METGVQRDHVMAVLQSALERPPEERQAYVRNACSDDQSFYLEVTDALDWEERMGSFLKQPMLDFTFLVRPFEPGQVLLDRFEILREIGEGGMGVVYEAFDRRLQQNIAIKAAKPGFQRLLSPELKAALKVRHRNICVLNEIHTAQTEYGEIDFLTMELLEGETLAAYLKKVGKLEHEEALDIACQICAGLAEAHYSGILHRDLKSGNIILTKNEDGSRRVVITDFGLAGAQPLAADEMAGTPAYMAPELWRGEQPSKASDIYALGVMIYELVTGSRPYEREEEAKFAKLSTLSLGKDTVQGDLQRPSLPGPADPWPHGGQLPAPPSEWVKGLDSRWDRVTMRCLEISPAERPQDAGEVLGDLQHEPINKTPFAIAALVLTSLMAVVGLVRPLRQAVMDYIRPPNVRLAVLPFDGPQDLDALGQGALQEAAERIRQLSGGRRTVAVIIPPPNIRTLQQARDALHATHALLLSAKREPEGSVLARSAVIDLKSRLPLKEQLGDYTVNELGAMPLVMSGLVAQAFRLGEPNADDKLAPVASESYLKGVYFLRRDTHSFDQAIEQFQKAASLDPNSALPPAGMALAFVQKFKRQKQAASLDQAQRFLQVAQRRNPDSIRVLLAAGTVDVATSQYLRALQDYRRVRELDPKNLDALLGIADVYDSLREPDQAIAAYREAEQLDPEYYKPYHMLGAFYDEHGQYQEAADQLREMVKRAPGLPDSYSALAVPLMQLGVYDEAEQAVQRSLQLRETAQGLNNAGVIRYFQGRYAEAADYQKRALTYDPGNYIWLVNLAGNLRLMRQSSEARLTYFKAKKAAQSEIALDPQSAGARSYFAYSCARLGETERAEEEIAQALSLAPTDAEVLQNGLETYESLHLRDLALQVFERLNPAVWRQLRSNPDLANFFQDPRVKKMIDQGGQ